MNLTANVTIKIDGNEAYTTGFVSSSWADLILAVMRFLIGAKDYTEGK